MLLCSSNCIRPHRILFIVSAFCTYDGISLCLVDSTRQKKSHITLQRRTKQTFGSDKFCTRTFFCPLKTANFALFHFQNNELCANFDVSVFACSVYSDIWFEFGFEFHWQNIMSNERRHSFWQCDLYIWIFRVSERECTVHAWVQIPTLLSLSLTCKF